MKNYISFIAVLLLMIPVTVLAATNDPTALHDRGNQKLVGNLSVSGEVNANSSSVSTLTADSISTGSISTSAINIQDDQKTEGVGYFYEIGIGEYESAKNPFIYFFKTTDPGGSFVRNLSITHKRKRPYSNIIEEYEVVSVNSNGDTKIKGELSVGGLTRGSIKPVSNSVIFSIYNQSEVDEFLEEQAVTLSQWFNNQPYTAKLSAPFLYIQSDGITGAYGDCSNRPAGIPSCSNLYDSYKDDNYSIYGFCNLLYHKTNDVGTFAVRNDGTLLYCASPGNKISYVPAAQTSSMSSAVSFGSSDYSITSGTVNTNNLNVQNKLNIPVIESNDISVYCMQQSDGTFGFNMNDDKLFICVGDTAYTLTPTAN